jgi:hypothetical protein
MFINGVLDSVARELPEEKKPQVKYASRKKRAPRDTKNP